MNQQIVLTGQSVIELHDLRGSGSRPPQVEDLPHPVKILLPRGARAPLDKDLFAASWATASPECFGATYVGGDLYSLPVEAAVLRMARNLSVPRIALLIDEMCGSFRTPRSEAIVTYREAFPRARAHFSPRGSDALTCKSASFYGLAPLTSVDSLASYVEHHPGEHGAKRVRQTLPFCVDGLRSYLEAISYHQMCMPPRLGGCNMEAPLVNYRIDLPPDLQAIAGSPYIVADNYWPNHSLVLELLGFSDHGGDGITNTSLREKIYALLGIECKTMTYTEVVDDRLFMCGASCIAKLLGTRIRSDGSDFAVRRQWLREELLLSPHVAARGRITYHELKAELADQVPLELRDRWL